MHLIHTYLVVAILAALPARAHSSAAINIKLHTSAEPQTGKLRAIPTNAASGATVAIAPDANPIKSWSKYDFIPGDNVLFEDNMIGEGKGEFPAHWHLHKGVVEVAIYGSENTLDLVENGTSMSPLMAGENWLPESATIEMDLFFETDDPKVTYEIYLVEDTGKHKKALNGNFSEPIIIGASSVHFKKEGAASAVLAAAGAKEQWRHLAIALDKGSLKVYLDQYRLLDMPQVKGQPSGLKIQVKKRHAAETLVKQIFIAEASGKKPADQLQAEGKFITQGIKFIPGSASVLPESVGTLNAIAELMQQQPDLKLSIESHTDSQGDDRFNMKLSQQRAEATKASLINIGIAPARLSATGRGETQPVSSGDTPELRLNNRRTAFVKQ